MYQVLSQALLSRNPNEASPGGLEKGSFLPAKVTLATSHPCSIISPLFQRISTIQPPVAPLCSLIVSLPSFTFKRTQVSPIRRKNETSFHPTSLWLLGLSLLCLTGGFGTTAHSHTLRHTLYWFTSSFFPSSQPHLLDHPPRRGHLCDPGRALVLLSLHSVLSACRTPQTPASVCVQPRHILRAKHLPLIFTCTSQS